MIRSPKTDHSQVWGKNTTLASLKLGVDGQGTRIEIANSREITIEEHRKARTLINRIKWGIAYFIVAVADYRITHRLNFAAEELLD